MNEKPFPVFINDDQLPLYGEDGNTLVLAKSQYRFNLIPNSEEALSSFI
jgi:hypothetical protein